MTSTSPSPAHEHDALWKDVRTHVETEARVLTWIQADSNPAAGESGDSGQVTQPEMTDLDSFTFIQLVLTLEAAYTVELLEELGDFSGTTFDDVASFVAERIERARRSAAGSADVVGP